MTDQAEPLVIGVDLTADPLNPTQACVLRGRRFIELRALGKDDELVEMAYRLTPDLIAIDAPLTPPLGLVGTYGQRVAERDLRKAGFQPFSPALIATLTFRGMRLKHRLQRHEVIEVFPRATFQCLGHTFRVKKTDATEWTACAKLLAAHVQGLPELRSHDEVDAVACALTGALHLEGGTRAYGSSGEGLVWVPKLSESEPHGRTGAN